MNAFSSLVLATPRLALRPLVPDDAPALFALKSDPEVMRYGSTPPWGDPAAAVDYIRRDVRDMSSGVSAQLAIVPRGESALIGLCNLRGFDAQCRRAEVGYSLARPAWGRGLANDAVTALLDWGFDRLDLNRIEADIDPRNTPSARALERLGFVREGHLRERWIVGGEVCDSWLYGLLRSDWEARR